MQDDDSALNASIDRRTFVAGLGAGATAGLAGCTGVLEEGGGSRPSGGTATFGLPTAPGTLNPLSYSSAYEYEIIRRVYDFGTTVHPENYEFKPWTFTDWNVNAENAGTSSPTITATMRTDTEFSDGEAVTPEDYKFTIEYLQEQGVTGSISAAQVEYVEEVKVAGDDGVELFLSEPYNAWFGDILGQIILPQHIWKDVSTYDKYEPRNEGGPVGSGPMELTDYSWEQWFELEYRDDSVIPWPSAEGVNWIHDDGPFLDAHRIEIFGNQATMQQELLAGNLTCVYQGVTPSTAQEAQNKPGVELAQNPSVGYDHISFNMRRVPFDDRAFRQFLRKMVDSEWIVQEPYNGIGAEPGTYASIGSFADWRPPEPGSVDEFEGIPIPTLNFPGEAGTFSLDQSAIDEARSFLTDHEEAKHDYTFEEGSQGNTNAPDGLQLFVNGEPLVDAHTNNDGEGGQGPLEFSYQPPGEDRTQNLTGEEVIGALRRVGVPMTKSIDPVQQVALSKVYIQENFDMYSMGWSVTPYLTLYRQLYGAAGVDDGSQSEQTYYNPMGYTGAQDLIEQDLDTMERSERIPIVKKIQAQIWYDAPTVITAYKNLLEPHPAEFKGFYNTAGGLFENPWMNVYQEESN